MEEGFGLGSFDFGDSVNSSRVVMCISVNKRLAIGGRSISIGGCNAVEIDDSNFGCRLRKREKQIEAGD